ncbi:MAG: hypothetical protein ACJ72Z_05470 [Pyrinomonadaceae bacterium]
MYLFGRNILVTVSFFLVAISGLLLVPASASGQAVAQNNVATADAAPKSGHWAYRSVSIGMKTDETRKALGNPKEKADDQDLYMFTDDELAQIYYDASHAISAISITYYNDLKKAPTAKDVLGEDAAPKPDGSVFKTVRFAKAGYSVSYSKTAGSSPSVSITFQKL